MLSDQNTEGGNLDKNSVEKCQETRCSQRERKNPQHTRRLKDGRVNKSDTKDFKQKPCSQSPKESPSSHNKETKMAPMGGERKSSVTRISSGQRTEGGTLDKTDVNMSKEGMPRKGE